MIANLSRCDQIVDLLATCGFRQYGSSPGTCKSHRRKNPGDGSIFLIEAPLYCRDLQRHLSLAHERVYTRLVTRYGAPLQPPVSLRARVSPNSHGCSLMRSWARCRLTL